MIRFLPFIISILIHLALITLFTIHFDREQAHPIPVSIQFRLESQNQTSSPVLEEKAVPVEKRIVRAVSPKTADSLLSEDRPPVSMRTFRGALQPAFQEPEEIESTHEDSLIVVQKYLETWFAEASREAKTMKSVEHLSSSLTNKAHESVPMASQIPAKEKKPKVYTTKFDFIPTPLQTEMLRILFLGEEQSLQDLYIAIADSFSVTQGSMKEELSELYHHGVIRERKVLLKPPILLFGISVEPNSISRKNPIYYYQAAIKKDIFQDYLQSLISRFSKSDSTSVRKRQLMEACLLILSGD